MFKDKTTLDNTAQRYLAGYLTGYTISVRIFVRISDRKFLHDISFSFLVHEKYLVHIRKGSHNKSSFLVAWQLNNIFLNSRKKN